MQYVTSPCRDADCRTEVIWAITARGRLMPVDPEPAADGTVMLTGQADAPVATVVNPAQPPLGGWPALYRTHFSTCPGAERWRTRRRRLTGRSGRR